MSNMKSRLYPSRDHYGKGAENSENRGWYLASAYLIEDLAYRAWCRVPVSRGIFSRMASVGMSRDVVQMVI